MRERVISQIRKALASAGLELRRVDESRINLHGQRRLLLSALDITLVVDVGANAGQYAGTHLREWTGYTGRIVSLEPVAASFEACCRAAASDPSWEVLPFGLSDRPRTAKMLVPGGASDLSSLTPLTSDGQRLAGHPNIAEELVELRRLDDVINEIATREDRIAVKIDTQGHEAKVLRGAVNALKWVDLLECELPLQQMYAEQESLEDLVAFMRRQGFSPCGFSTNWTDPLTGLAMDVDGFFARKSQRCGLSAPTR